MTSRSDSRIRLLAVSALAVYLVFAVLLFNMQAIQASSNPNTDTAAVKSYNVAVDSTRGEILDRNGQPLVQNRQGTDVVIYNLSFPEDKTSRNNILLSLIRALESNGDTWIDDLPLVFAPNGRIMFAEERESDIAFLKSDKLLHLNDYATAQNCLDAFISDYELKAYSADEQRKLASVYYSMAKQEFSNYAPYTFAEDISMKSAAFIMENNEYFRGVQTVVSAYREYDGDGTLAAHILGVVGTISADEYEREQTQLAKLLSDETLSPDSVKQLKAKSYSMNDEYGKFGIEAAMETYLRGTRGTQTFRVDTQENISSEYSELPLTGGAVVTTINKDMQKVAQESLAERIRNATQLEALAKGLSPAGAVVVLDIHSGAVLASASYPTFNLEDYYKDYNTLLEQAGKPLWNRAMQSTYSPGSTMKCAIAVAALEEGIINRETRLYCEGTYKFHDVTFSCFQYRAHGWINAEQALEHSCNIFFYQLAEKLGIEKIQEYASLFGLGSLTGIEISESKGILAGPQYRDSIGQSWQQGETLLAAIGQSDNSFSLLQLANYVATIANGGTRYTPYLIEKVLSDDYDEVLYRHETTVSAQTGLSQENLDIVKSGMLRVATLTSCWSSFSSLPYKVAAKTGTAEKTLLVGGVYVEGTDGFLISFGPYKDPQIAIAVVVENAGSGASTAQVAADIYEFYFEQQKEIEKRQPENQLIG